MTDLAFKSSGIRGLLRAPGRAGEGGAIGILGISVVLILAILGTILFEIVFFGAGQVT